MNLKAALTCVFAALATAIAPPPKLSNSAWASQHAKLIDGPKAGELWDARDAPYLEEVLECLSPDHPCNRVSVMKSVQTAFTTAGMIWTGTVIDMYPAKMMTVFPTIITAQDYNREKLQPFIEAWPKRLRDKVRDQTSRSGKGSTAMAKKFAGGSLILTGANSAADLQAKTIKFLNCDEVDQWPQDLDGQGDPMSMADDRQTAFHASGDYKKFEIGTPTLKGMSRIGDAFRAGDQRHYNIACPECGVLQVLVWEQLRYNTSFPYNAEYECPHCSARIKHHQKRGLLQKEAGACWIARQAEPGRHPSFHINALYSLLTTWDKIVEKYLDAKDSPSKLKGFINRWLALEWEEQGEAPDHVKLLGRRENTPLGLVPPRCLFITAAADVQGDYVQWAVWGWGAACGEEWLLDAGIIPGDTKKLATFKALDEVRRRQYRNALGRQFEIEAFAIDSGYSTNNVYRWARGKPRVLVVKGYSGQNPHLQPPITAGNVQDIDEDGRRIKGGVQLWSIGTWGLKSEFYANLRVTIDGPDQDGRFPPGYVHLPEKLVDEGYLRQLTAERLMRREKAGRLDLRWEKDRDQANEALDIRIYARAAASWLYADRMTPEEWLQLAAQRGAPPEDVQMALALQAGLVAPQSRAGDAAAALEANGVCTTAPAPAVADDRPRRVEGIGRKVD